MHFYISVIMIPQDDLHIFLEIYLGEKIMWFYLGIKFVFFIFQHNYENMRERNKCQ